MSALDERLLESEPVDADRRDSFRMPKPDQMRCAKLKIGKQLVEVQVLDESAGGFLVSANQIPKTNAMETVELFQPSGAQFLRVAWRRNVDGRIRLGLQRLCQSPPKQESPWLIWMVAAVVIGIGVGFVAATSGHPNLFDRMPNTGHVTNPMAVPAPTPTPISRK